MRPLAQSASRCHGAILVALCAGLLFSSPAGAAIPATLKGLAPPATPGLIDGGNPIVIDRAAAIRLGKALFWDSAVGSDGVACATCHFHAGADRRTRHQIDPGSRHAGAATAATFETARSGAASGPDYSLRLSDFPLQAFERPEDKGSKLLFDTDDVVSSSGTFLGAYRSDATPTGDGDACDPESDPVFQRGSWNTRRVSTRNAPTIYNAVYNHRNFWDGRANNLFNGKSAYGPRDPDAGVWEVRPGGTEYVKILLGNASLASQAVAPPLDDREMSCRKRTLKDLGRKLIPRRALANQAVHPEDSVLGAHRDGSGRGLAATYGDLVRRAFAPRYWSGNGNFGAPPGGGPAYVQMEANFPFFFGLALQLYESTLISDQTPFDEPRDAHGYPRGYTSEQKRGLDLFVKECSVCHLGPTFTAAAYPAIYNVKNAPTRLVDRRVINGDFDGLGVAFAFMDIGYANTSVTPTERDPGLGGADPYGNPLSFTAQYLSLLREPGRAMIDPVLVQPCYFTTQFSQDFRPDELMLPRGKDNTCPRDGTDTARVPEPGVMARELALPEQGRIPAAVQGAFKIPGLRNIELTGPYMHNGSLKNLEEVIAFYERGGNFANPHHIGNLVFPRPFGAADKTALLAFLKTLTDERVRWERAPFDHPALSVPHGHLDQAAEGRASRAADRWLEVPAVGRLGRDAAQGPLLPFENYLAP